MADLLGDNPVNGALTLGTPTGASATGPVRLRGPLDGGGSDVRKVIPVIRRSVERRKRIQPPGGPSRTNAR